ncbi:hypothetical protein Pint_06991 [Pistacia integerrima]|uniref:Uncharacterized protein n=1 Tax=Pistacia integerrima TaxID=434235 RepID=A0ACC0XYA8_9ROSI|nr:hypothetical protein Pint_06991 [Pistacia integerrima]
MEYILQFDTLARERVKLLPLRGVKFKRQNPSLIPISVFNPRVE